MHVAVGIGRSADVVVALLDAGADPRASDNDGWAAIHWAAQHADSPDVFAALVAAGADPNAAPVGVPTPLGIAVANDRSAGVVAALVDAGANANAADEDGWTALHWAAKHAASPHVFAALVAEGADPDAADDSGWTPLHVAARDNSASVVRALIELGADARRRTSHGWSALTTATMLAGDPMVAGELLRLHLPAMSLTDDRRWRRRGLHEATCWFEHDRAWPPKQCYYFVVHEDHGDSASSLIAFPVVRLRSSGARPQDNPILHLGGGGPGRAMDFETDPFSIWSAYGALALGSGRDLYVIDPRGVGMSYPRLHCREALAPVREGLSRKLDGHAESMLLSAAYVACKTRLDREGRGLSHYNSATVAEDVEALRRALGVERWVLWGQSYGARYALTVARDFPLSIEAMVLSAAAFPGRPGAETRAGDMERAIERAFDHCHRVGVCDAQSLRRRFWELVRSSDEEPLLLGDLEVLSHHSVDRLELTGARLLRAVFAALYDGGFFEVFPFLVQQLEHGRTSILEQHVLPAWLGILLDETYSHPVAAAHYCAEEQPFIDFEHAVREARKANDRIRRLVETGFEIEKQRCRNWDVAPAPLIEGEPVQTSIPTIFLQGALDPVTPIDRLDGQLANFADHEVLVFEDGSHWGLVDGHCAMLAAAYFLKHKGLEERLRQCAAASASPSDRAMAPE